MLTKTCTRATCIPSATGGVAVRRGGQAEAAQAQRRTRQAATPCRSNTTNPAGRPSVEPVSTWVRKASYALTASASPLGAASLVTAVFFGASQGPLDAAWMHLQMEPLPQSPRQLPGAQ